MTPRAHARLFLLAALAWLAFWLAGLPDYYQQYSTRSLVGFELLLLGPVGAVGYLALRERRRVSRVRRPTTSFRSSCWCRWRHGWIAERRPSDRGEPQ